MEKKLQLIMGLHCSSFQKDFAISFALKEGTGFVGSLIHFYQALRRWLSTSMERASARPLRANLVAE